MDTNTAATPGAQNRSIRAPQDTRPITTNTPTTPAAVTASARDIPSLVQTLIRLGITAATPPAMMMKAAPSSHSRGSPSRAGAPRAAGFAVGAASRKKARVVGTAIRIGAAPRQT